MPLEIRTNEDLKKMIGFMIDNVAIAPGGTLVLTLTHISEPGVKYEVQMIPEIQFGLSGTVMTANKGLMIKSVGLVKYEQG